MSKLVDQAFQIAASTVVEERLTLPQSVQVWWIEKSISGFILKTDIVQVGAREFFSRVAFVAIQFREQPLASDDRRFGRLLAGFHDRRGNCQGSHEFRDRGN